VLFIFLRLKLDISSCAAIICGRAGNVLFWPAGVIKKSNFQIHSDLHGVAQ